MKNQPRTCRTLHWERRRHRSNLPPLGDARQRKESVRIKWSCSTQHWENHDGDGEVDCGMHEQRDHKQGMCIKKSAKIGRVTVMKTKEADRALTEGVPHRRKSRTGLKTRAEHEKKEITLQRKS